jgi:hypothetical protein
VCGNSGGFSPFSSATIARRYSEDGYITRYERNLDRLVQEGLVLRDDRIIALSRARAAYRAARAG